MSIRYFSEQELGPGSRTVEVIGEGPWGALVAIVRSRITDGSFGFRFGDECPDGRGIFGTSESSFSLALKGEVPEINWPLHPKQVPPTLAILDLIQFCYQFIAEPIQVDHHEYFGHYHLNFNQEHGRETFRNDINRIFSRNGISYELEAEGNIIRLGPEMLREDLANAVFNTGDSELNAMLELGRRKFLSPDLNLRKEALEKLWDAWERVKTLEIPGENNKKASTTQLLDKVANERNFRSLVEQDAIILTNVGNTFQIRHSETYKTSIQICEHVDYLFHRLFALLRLVLRMSGRGG